jgi:hypothetical protein
MVLDHEKFDRIRMMTDLKFLTSAVDKISVLSALLFRNIMKKDQRSVPYDVTTSDIPALAIRLMFNGHLSEWVIQVSEESRFPDLSFRNVKRKDEPSPF